jgi:hypothetical protein
LRDQRDPRPALSPMEADAKLAIQQAERHFNSARDQAKLSPRRLMKPKDLWRG